METITLEEKQYLIHKAIQAYLDDPEVTLEKVFEESERQQYKSLLEGKTLEAIALLHYDLSVEKYKVIREEIDQQGSMNLEESISTFLYILFDLLGEERTFIQQTFDKHIITDLQGDFRRFVVEEIGRILKNEEVPLTNSMVTQFTLLHEFLSFQILLLLRFWKNDTSEGQQETLALTEKLINLFSEVATFRGIDQSIEVVKYLININASNLSKIPFVGSFFGQEKEEV